MKRATRLGWLGVVGGGLALVLLAVAMVQARQFAMLRQRVAPGEEFVLMTAQHTELEYLQLREQWRRAVEGPRPPDIAALRLRYEIWVSRVGLLSAARTGRFVDGHEDLRRTRDQVQRFIAAADRALGTPHETEPTAAFLLALLPTLEALAEPIHGLSDSAAQRTVDQIETRVQAVREQNKLGLALTGFLSLLTLAFAYIAWRQLHQLGERRAALETLADSLRQSQREAEAASAAKSTFLANMSHEIRTPFQGLMGMLSLLRETGLTPRQIDYLRTATESADHLLAILNDILDKSQLESGRMSLTPAPLDLRGLLRDVEALIRPQAAAKGLALHIDAEPGVPERILGDAKRVKQVLFNLLSNGVKFSDRGTVVLDVRCKADEKEQPELHFIVTDTGIGMDEAMLARLFTRFAQADPTPARRHGGTGLGLEISRDLARLMGGDITAQSRAGVGSSFVFRMPLRQLPAEAPPHAALTAAQAPAAQPLQVLVAEDHPLNRQYMAALLKSLGHEAHFSANGVEAVAAARERSFDIVLMDLHMPELDGIGATRAIRALSDPARSTVPIVALTADAFDETRERCLVAGMNDFLTKPVSPQKLSTSLRRLFGAARVPASGAPAEAAALPARGDAQSLIDPAAINASLQAMPRERLAEMIEAFLDQGPQTVQRLRAAVRDAQPLELRVNAHAAKGAALNLGLSALAATADALHEGAAHLPAHEIARLVQRYEELLPQTRTAAQQLGILAPGVKR
ncbi:Sensor protein [Rubrivivax sp. A210]|uniref:hybrid sensor histidine kinase/response regulator n=1 Tax=Rubrivivax sp. A210 TaxID=2772301 RepID=UPI0019A75599|nr:ATP-binding protein [Rubrivivax sp. A210]CAD5372972.1 Sensor protein [Rubrivivax sp. A210]